MKKQWMYLSFRVMALFISLGVLVICGAYDIITHVRVVFGFLIVSAVSWVWVIRPYLQTEKTISLFLERYTLPASEISDKCAISPATWLLLQQFREVLNPAQLFNMNKQQAQYLALQNQINPHFLYNTLESIRSEALLAGLCDVADMTESLATFFRYTITKVENLVSVEEELQNCETYFSIQQYRFGDRLKLTIQCASEERDEIYRCRIPKLTMQPILENSIIHGTELKIGTGHLTIYLGRTEKRLLIRISDNGLGMDEEKVMKINGKLNSGNFNITKQEEATKGGLALVNVNNRIRLLFGDEYGLHVFSIPGVGTDVEISLPAIGSDRDIKNREMLI